jgi:hypothetical protein
LLTDAERSNSKEEYEKVKKKRKMQQDYIGVKKALDAKLVPGVETKGTDSIFVQAQYLMLMTAFDKVLFIDQAKKHKINIFRKYF